MKLDHVLSAAFTGAGTLALLIAVVIAGSLDPVETWAIASAAALLLVSARLIRVRELAGQSALLLLTAVCAIYGISVACFPGIWTESGGDSLAIAAQGVGFAALGWAGFGAMLLWGTRRSLHRGGVVSATRLAGVIGVTGSMLFSIACLYGASVGGGLVGTIHGLSDWSPGGGFAEQAWNVGWAVCRPIALAAGPLPVLVLFEGVRRPSEEGARLR